MGNGSNFYIVMCPFIQCDRLCILLMGKSLSFLFRNLFIILRVCSCKMSALLLILVIYYNNSLSQLVA